ncbi:MAG: FAD-dependent monooxygenase [Pseudomonadales bacterium]
MVDVAIAGAGIGGLTLALACRHAGMQRVTVYEQAERIEALGAGIQLSPNATRVLHALGLREALAEVGFLPQSVHLRAWRTGYLIAMRPLGQFSESRYGAPYYHIHRGDLQCLLHDAAIRHQIDIQTGRTCRGLAQDGSGVTLAFSDGRHARHDLVVGCDGIHSAIHAALFGDGAPRFTGHVAWRGLVPSERLPDDLIPPTATAWLGPARHFVHYYVRRGELVNFVGVTEDPHWTSESWRQAGDRGELAAAFDGWHPALKTLIDASDDVFKWALYDREPLPRWSVGRATLLGDACHPMLPYLAQGGAMAIEDAWVLARMLDRWEEEVSQALSEYERYRRPRTARVQLASRAQGHEFHLTDRWQMLARNLKLGLGSRYLPEMAMQRYDWLHGYDCIRGFE